MQLPAELRTQLDNITLTILSTLLQRNPQFKLLSSDHELIRPTNHPPDMYAFVSSSSTALSVSPVALPLLFSIALLLGQFELLPSPLILPCFTLSTCLIDWRRSID